MSHTANPELNFADPATRVIVHAGVGDLMIRTALPPDVVRNYTFLSSLSPVEKEGIPTMQYGQLVTLETERIEKGLRRTLGLTLACIREAADRSPLYTYATYAEELVNAPAHGRGNIALETAALPVTSIADVTAVMAHMEGVMRGSQQGVSLSTLALGVLECYPPHDSLLHQALLSQ